MMGRKETTDLLTDVLITSRLSDRKYYAREVTIDYGTNHSKRVDVMQFIPEGTIYASDIEKGIFVCYEIKSCYEDVYSGNGLNFYGEKNYIVTTMDTYKRLQDDIRTGKLQEHICKINPESSKYYGFLVPVPVQIDTRNSENTLQEYENPTKFEGCSWEWKLHSIMYCRKGPRTRSTTELLFCMLRSKHNYSSQV